MTVSLGRVPVPQIATAYRDVCRLDVAVLKPGNVHRHAGGHGMTAADFAVSAEVSAGPLTERDRCVGERVYRAVVATRRAVGCNTNLGILMLCAPLMQVPLDRSMGGGLRVRLHWVLQALGAADTAWMFRAIRLADPGGLGESENHDVRRAPPDAPLLEVMAHASARDRIARQYATGYADLFDYALPLLAQFQARWSDEAWSAAALYMDLLRLFPDTHIVRKHGLTTAREVRRRVKPLAEGLCRCERPEDYRGRLLQLDRELKREGINPGTSADLTVAALLMLRVERMCRPHQPAVGLCCTERARSTGPGCLVQL